MAVNRCESCRPRQPVVGAWCQLAKTRTLNLPGLISSPALDFMKIIAFFLFSLLAAEAVIAEQRLLDMRHGVPCDRISETEKILGSVELTVNDSDGVSKYTGIHGGLDASIVYVCEEGQLVEQTIVILTSNRDAAYRFANKQKAELTRRFGSPLHDGFDLGIWSRLFFGFKGSDLDYLSEVVVWGRAKEDMMLSVKQNEQNLWEITISQGIPKVEYILNS